MSNKKSAQQKPDTHLKNQVNNITKKEVVSILKESGEPMTSKEIMLELKVRGYDIGDRSLRKIREELLNEGVPICSAKTMGYYIAKNDKEIKIAVDDYLSKAKALIKCAHELEQIDAKEYWND